MTEMSVQMIVVTVTELVPTLLILWRVTTMKIVLLTTFVVVAHVTGRATHVTMVMTVPLTPVMVTAAV